MENKFNNDPYKKGQRDFKFILIYIYIYNHTRVLLLALGSLSGLSQRRWTWPKDNSAKAMLLKNKRGMKWKESGNFYIKKEKFTNAFLIIYCVDYMVVNIGNFHIKKKITVIVSQFLLLYLCWQNIVVFMLTKTWFTVYAIF